MSPSEIVFATNDHGRMRRSTVSIASSLAVVLRAVETGEELVFVPMRPALPDFPLGLPGGPRLGLRLVPRVAHRADKLRDLGVLRPSQQPANAGHHCVPPLL